MVPAYVAAWALNKGRAQDVAHVGDVRTSSQKRKPRAKKERVLQTKGGGGTPPPPDPMKEAQARDWEASQAAQRAKEQAAADKIIQDAKAAQELAQWQGRVSNAITGAEQYGRGQLERYGLGTDDPYGIWRQFTNNLTQGRNSLANNQDFSGVINNSVFDNILDDTRSATRSKYARDLTANLGNDYLDTTFANTIDDSILDAILGDQYTGAQTSLKNAMDRGQMSQIAYDRALSSLGTKKTAARGELETMGRNAITGLRNDVNTVLGNAQSKANNFDFGDTFDVGAEANKIRGATNDAMGRLDSAVRTAVGDKQFFDPNSIIQSAIASGGASNYTPAAGIGGVGVGVSDGKQALGTIFNDQARQKQTEGMF